MCEEEYIDDLDYIAEIVKQNKKLIEENVQLQRENKQLKKKYENAVVDYDYEKYKNNKVIENCKKSIESINQKLQDDKIIKFVDGIVINMNEYQIVRLKAIRMKCKELLEILEYK